MPAVRIAALMCNSPMYKTDSAFSIQHEMVKNLFNIMQVGRGRGMIWNQAIICFFFPPYNVTSYYGSTC